MATTAGNYTPRLVSVRHTTTLEADKHVFTFVGPLAQLEAMRPQIGASGFRGAPGIIVEIETEPGQSTEGTLRVVVEQRTIPGADGPQQQTIEVEWVELRKKLHEHPRYASIPNDQLRAVLDHISSPRENTGPNLSNARAMELYQKMLNGHTEYSIGAPIVRRTTYSPASLSHGGAWYRENPPYGPSGWQWLKTADRLMRTGPTWQRIEEWTGFESVDSDIYPPT